MTMKLFMGILAVAMAIPATVEGQTVVVNKTATPDSTTYNTISDALAAVAADIQQPDVVQITDSAVYDEVFNITSPVELVGTAEQRPTLEVLSNSNGTGTNGGIVINLPETITSGSVKLKNLIVLPASGVVPNARLRTAIENKNNNLYLEIDNVLITANNGNDQPLVTTALASDLLKLVPTNVAYDPNVIPFGAHGIVLGRTSINSVAQYEGEGVELVFKDSLITHFRNDYHPAGTEPERAPTCIVMHTPFADNNNPNPALRRITRILGESGISYARVGLSIVGDLDMQSDGEKIQVVGHGNDAIRLDGPALNFRNIHNVNFSNNSARGLLDRGFGSLRFHMKDCTSIFTLNQLIHVETSGGTAAGLITIEDSTLVGGRHHATAGKLHLFRFEPATVTNVLVRNTILGGKMNHSQPSTNADLSAIRSFNVISLAGTNNVTLEGSAVIAQGPYAFRVAADGASLALSASANSVVTGNPIQLDPLFQVVDPNQSLNPGFLDVQHNGYATASATGGPLGGGADFIGGLTKVQDWAIY